MTEAERKAFEYAAQLCRKYRADIQKLRVAVYLLSTVTLVLLVYLVTAYVR